jgi:2'-5' RNA ligase
MSRAAKGDIRRLFVAVDPPPEAVEHLGAVVDTLGVSRANAPGRSTRMAARDRWHLTLAFLGDLPAGRVDDAAVAVARAAAAHAAVARAAADAAAARAAADAAAARAAADAAAARAAADAAAARAAADADVADAAARAAAAPGGPIAIRFAGGGRFGRGRFTVLWAGVDGDMPALRALAKEVRSELKRGKLPFDDKSFRPHLTISRVGDRVGPDIIVADVETLSAYVGPLWTVDSVHLVASTLGPHPQHTKVSSTPLSRG